MPDKAQFVGRWVHWDGPARIEQELFADGRFEGVVFDEEQGEVFGNAKGNWQIVDDAIHWRYTSAENVPVPKKVDVNPIIHVDENRFDVRERSRRCSDWYRLVKSEETSTNFDYEQVQPFLERIAASIDSGFGGIEIAALMKKMQRLRPDQTCQVVFSITCNGVVSPFRIRIFMDDVDAPDVYFYAPVKLARRIDDEIENLDSKTGG